MAKTLTLFVLLSAIFTVSSRAQSPSNTPLQLGTLTINSGPNTCPSGWSPVTSCYTATISGCGNNGANVDNIGLTFGGIYSGTNNPQGTVVFLTGGTGTTVWDPNMDVAQYAIDYAAYFEVVYFAWDTPWEEPNQTSDPGSVGGDILLAACRPATFLSYINSSQSGFHNYGAMCAQGSSAGSKESKIFPQRSQG